MDSMDLKNILTWEENMVVRREKDLESENWAWA